MSVTTRTATTAAERSNAAAVVASPALTVPPVRSSLLEHRAARARRLGPLRADMERFEDSRRADMLATITEAVADIDFDWSPT